MIPQQQRRSTSDDDAHYKKGNAKANMAGHILLAGGAEFGGLMVKADLRAMMLAGGRDAPISILPTAAVPDSSYQSVGDHAVYWFRSFGARNVRSLPLIDRDSANDPVLAVQLRRSRLIYLTSGFMDYLRRTLKGSACWYGILAAYEAGAVIAGSAAGAMLLCEYFFEPATREIKRGLGLLPNTCVLPHHNMFGKGWVERLTRELPNMVILGIDERTAMIDDGAGGKRRDWNVYGQGTVTRYRNGIPTVYNAGQRITDSFREQV
jgi:cyanophycinase